MIACLGRIGIGVEYAVMLLLAPLLLPLFGLRVGYETWARALAWPIPRRRGWVRLWWWYGYHGLYQIDWWMKARA